MGFYLDSADRREITAALRLPYIAGVTTNPSLVAAAAGAALSRADYYEQLTELIETTACVIFVQVLEADRETMRRESERLGLLAPGRVIIKVPCTADGLHLVRELRGQGITTAVTAVFSLRQTVAAAETKAGWVAVYYDRYRRRGGDADALLGGLLAVLRERNLSCHLLAASIKSVADVEAVVRAGVRDMTMPLAVLEQLLTHELTADALRQFRESVRG